MEQMKDYLKEKLNLKNILTIVGLIAGIFLFMFVKEKSTCLVGAYNYTRLDGTTGIADTCSYDNGVPVCKVGNSITVVSNFYKNKWCK